MDEVWQKRQKKDIIGMNFTTRLVISPFVETVPFQTDVHNHIMADMFSQFFLLLFFLAT